MSYLYHEHTEKGFGLWALNTSSGKFYFLKFSSLMKAKRLVRLETIWKVYFIYLRRHSIVTFDQLWENSVVASNLQIDGIEFIVIELLPLLTWKSKNNSHYYFFTTVYTTIPPCAHNMINDDFACNGVNETSEFFSCYSRDLALYLSIAKLSGERSSCRP